jgi:hypothetical protein
MTASRPSGRVRRAALTAAGLGVAAVALAPMASATPDYAPSSPPQGTQVLPVKYGPAPTSTTHHGTKHHTSSTQVLGTKYSSSSLAYTGAEVGGVAVGGVVLVVGGALLVRAGRRRSAA